MKQFLLTIYLIFVVVNSTISAQTRLAIDTANCYIIDNLYNADWGNTTKDTYLTGGTGGINAFTAFSSATTTSKMPVYRLDKRAEVNGQVLSYTFLQARTGNYDGNKGYINLKNLYFNGTDLPVYDSATQLKSYLQLPQLPSVGRIVLYLIKPYGSTTKNIIVESSVNGNWEEVAKVTIPSTDSWVYLDTIKGNTIQSAVPVTYRFRSDSYNSTTASGYGPLISTIMVQAYKAEGNPEIKPQHPYYSVTEIASTAIATANNILDNFSESQWLNLVPRQAPRSLQSSPENKNYRDWAWDPMNPDQIQCVNSGTVFPNNAFTEFTVPAVAMSGKTIQVPYYKVNGSTQITYVKAQIDAQKILYLRKVLPSLGAAYYYTGDERYARYVALVLDSLANSINDYFMTKGWNKSTIVNKDELQKYYDDAVNVQRVSEHNGLTAEYQDPELTAFDCIYNSNAFTALNTEKKYDVRKNILNNYFLNITDWIIKWRNLKEQLGNNLPNHINVMIRVADLCEDETEREKILDFVNTLLSMIFDENFNRDAIYPESFSYHRGYAASILQSLIRLNTHFTMFSPKNAEMKAIKNKAESLVDFCKKANRAQQLVAFPDGDLAPFDDTTAGYSTVRNTTNSTLLAAYKHAMLGDGVGNEQTQLNLSATDKANHIQNSMLHFTLFAKGKEQIGGIRYSRIPGRHYVNSTLSHNMVSVNGRSDQYFSNARQVPGNDGHVFTNGYFTLFEPNLQGISVMESYNNTVFLNQGVNRYQRLMLLNTIEPSRPYVVDVFVVNGGNQHDYVLHGSTQTDQNWITSLSTSKLVGTYPLLPKGQTYTEPLSEEDTTNWWGVFRDVSKAQVNSGGKPWNVTFSETNQNTSVRIWNVPKQNAVVYFSTTPNPYRRSVGTTLFDWTRPTLVERRIGTNLKSVFVHIIEPYSNKAAFIQSVTPIEPLVPSDEFIMLKIKFEGGREDIVMLNLNDKDITGKKPDQTLESITEQCALTGKAGIIYKPSTNVSPRGYLINGSQLTYKGHSLKIDNPCIEGTVGQIMRKNNGGMDNAIVIPGLIDTQDISSKRYVRLNFDTYNIINKPSGFNSAVQKNMSELYEINQIQQIDNKTYLYCSDDPCLELTATGAQETVRPRRIFNGPTTFMLTKSKVANFESDIPSNNQSTKELVEISIKPNPVYSGNDLEINTGLPVKQIDLYDLKGTAIKTYTIPGLTTMTTAIPDDLVPGLYLVNISYLSGQRNIVKLMIKRSYHN